jgi:catechol 2,3-dioxygenase-like lactoylglutathione lyase family enzyme
MRLEMYVAVDDMDRSIGFYTKLFGEAPARRTPNYAGFALGFGLMLSAGYSVPVKRGNSAVPTLIVDDLGAQHARLKTIASTVTEITSVGDFRLFRFMDPDGNVIEVAQAGEND